MPRRIWKHTMSHQEYLARLDQELCDIERRHAEGEDYDALNTEARELHDELRMYKNLFFSDKQQEKQTIEPVATAVVPIVEATVEEEPEEDEEWEDEEYSEDESEDEHAAYRHLFTPVEFEIIFGEDDDISEETRSRFIYAIRHKNPTVDAFLKTLESQHGVIEVIDPCNEVPKTEVVRDGDIISVRFVDGPPADKSLPLIEEPEKVEEEANATLNNPVIIITPEISSPLINGDVAHHPEPVIELSLDNARDELSIESKENGDTELSNENLKDCSVSIDEDATVDRHREEIQVNVDFDVPNVQNSLAQSDTPVDFIFSPGAFQSNPDPLIADEEPIKMWNPLDFLFGIISLLKNGAKKLASKIDRRRTKGALALPFDSCD